MDTFANSHRRRRMAVMAIGACISPAILAQSVFDTGINSFLAWAFVIAQPIAVLVVIALGLFTLAGKLNWVWFVGGLIGIGIVFGAEQIVGWIRSLFGV